MNPLNGFSGSVNVTVTGLPSGVTASPATLTLATASPQTITVTAAASADIGSFNVTLTATSGILSHQYSVTGKIVNAITGDAPLRTTYIDVGYSTYNFINSVGYPGWRISVYDPVRKLFFASVTFGSEVIAISPQSEEIVARISVPTPYGMDFSLDGNQLYVATATNFLYVIDPAKLQVSARIDMSNWGGQGYSMVQPLAVAGGRIGFLANLSSSVYVWNPSDNSVEHVVDYAWGAIRSRDGTKIAYSTANSPNEIGIFDVNTHHLLRGAPVSGGFTLASTFHPTQNTLLALGGANGYTHAVLYDENLNILHDYTPADGNIPSSFNYTNGFFARDGSLVFLEDMGALAMAVLDADTFQLKGYVQRMDPSAEYLGMLTQDIDETGLAVGASHQGIVLIDTKNVFSRRPALGPLSSPSGALSGPTSGGTAIALEAFADIANPGSASGTKVFFGPIAASVVSASYGSGGGLSVSATSPAGSLGAVNIGAYLPDGTMTMAASGFAYGPNIRDLNFTASTADGGPAVLYGYGLSKGATISVGDGIASGIAGTQGFVYSPGINQMSKLTYTIPPGPAGRSDLTLQTEDGSHTYRNSIRYYPAPEMYPLPGSTLWMGIYDPTRRLLYFTANDRVNVFSTVSESWLASIGLPLAPNLRRVRYVALSPHAGYLAVTDPGNSSLIVIDLSSQALLREVPLEPSGPVYAGDNFPAVFASETQVITLGAGELRLTDISAGNAVWRKTFTGSSSVSPHTKMVLDSTGRYLLFNTGAYIDLQEGGPGVYFHQWGCFADTVSEFTISSDGKVSQGGCIMGPDLKVVSQIYTSDAQYWSLANHFGQVWDSSGTYVLQPTTVGVDLIDAKRGNIRERITSSLILPDSDFAQVLDPDGQLLYLITDQGIAAFDIHSLPIGIGSVTPNSGPAGTVIQIRGTGFDAATQVIVDGQSVGSTIIDSNTLQFNAPQHPDGPVQIAVKAVDGSQDSLDAAFVYSATPLVASPDAKVMGEGKVSLNLVPRVTRVKQPHGERLTRSPANREPTPR
jgi:hypothetical protein